MKIVLPLLVLLFFASCGSDDPAVPTSGAKGRTELRFAEITEADFEKWMSDHQEVLLSEESGFTTQGIEQLDYTSSDGQSCRFQKVFQMVFLGTTNNNQKEYYVEVINKTSEPSGCYRDPVEHEKYVLLKDEPSNEEIQAMGTVRYGRGNFEGQDAVLLSAQSTEQGTEATTEIIFTANQPVINGAPFTQAKYSMGAETLEQIFSNKVQASVDPETLDLSGLPRVHESSQFENLSLLQNFYSF